MKGLHHHGHLYSNVDREVGRGEEAVIEAVATSKVRAPAVGKVQVRVVVRGSRSRRRRWRARADLEAELSADAPCGPAQRRTTGGDTDDSFTSGDRRNLVLKLSAMTSPERG